MITRAAAAAILARQHAKTGRPVASVVEARETRISPTAPAITLLVPVRVVNPLNGRQSWRTVHARGEREKYVTAAMFVQAAHRGLEFPALPIVVTLTRIGKQQMDSDAVPASLKHARDSVAKWYGVDDRDGGKIEWRYGQEYGRALEYGVRIEIAPAKERQAT